MPKKIVYWVFQVYDICHVFLDSKVRRHKTNWNSEKLDVNLTSCLSDSVLFAWLHIVVGLQILLEKKRMYLENHKTQRMSLTPTRSELKHQFLDSMLVFLGLQKFIK